MGFDSEEFSILKVEFLTFYIECSPQSTKLKKKKKHTYISDEKDHEPP